MDKTEYKMNFYILTCVGFIRVYNDKKSLVEYDLRYATLTFTLLRKKAVMAVASRLKFDWVFFENLRDQGKNFTVKTKKMVSWFIGRGRAGPNADHRYSRRPAVVEWKHFMYNVATKTVIVVNNFFW